MWIIAKSIFWMSLGILLVRWRYKPPSFSQRFGRSLYWIGVPLQIFVLGHQSEFPRAIWLPPLATVLVLLVGWGLATFCWQARQRLSDRYLHKDKNLRSPQREMVTVASRSSSVVALQPEIELFAQIRSRYLSSQGSFILASMLGNTVFVGFALAPTLLVIMSGMPTNSANAILAEEYNLDRQMRESGFLRWLH